MDPCWFATLRDPGVTNVFCNLLTQNHGRITLWCGGTDFSLAIGALCA